MENNDGKTALGLDLNVGALVCYVGNLVCALGLIYSIVVLATDKDNKLPRFHAFQSILISVAGILLFPVWMIAGVVGAVVDSALGFPVLSLLLTLVVAVIGLGIFVMTILAAVKAFQGELYKIPVIGGFADQWSG